MRKFVLASASPRRRELLANIIPEFRIIPSKCDESSDIQNPEELVLHLSNIKAADVAGRMRQGEIVIGADTIVVLCNRVLGKPKDAEEAASMLRSLSGKTHSVLTGITVIDTASGDCTSEYEKTSVSFGTLTEADIEAYIATGESMDKAGAYGIQGYAARFIQKIDGCYFNVVGLPLYHLYQLLKEKDLLEP